MITNRSHTVEVTNDTRYGPNPVHADRVIALRRRIGTGQRVACDELPLAGAATSRRADTPTGVTRKAGTAMAFSEAGPASRFHETPSREIGWRFCVGVRCGGSERLPTAVS